MNENIIKYFNEYFSFLTDEFNFYQEKKEYDENGYPHIIYQSKDIKIQIDKNRRELEVIIASILDPEKWVNLFMLIEYLNQNTNKNIKSNYYYEISDLDECYKKQMIGLAKIFKKYYPLILIFFQKDNYKENIIELNDFAYKRLGIVNNKFKKQKLPNANLKIKRNIDKIIN